MAGLSLAILAEDISSLLIGEQAKRARCYQGCTSSIWCGIYGYRGMCAIVVAHAMQCNVGGVRSQPFFLYVPAVSNVVTTRNGMGTKNVLKWNRALRFVFSILSSVYGATTVTKVSLFSTWTRSTVSFTLCKRRNRPI